MNSELIEKLLDADYRNRKVEEFNTVNTSLGKIKFWSKLGFNWIDQYDSDSVFNVPLEPFKFIIPKDEYEQVNIWILDNYLKLSNHPDKEKRIFSLDDLIDKFESALCDATDQRDYILKEQREVDQSFERAKTPQVGGSVFKPKLLPSYGINYAYYASTDTYFDYLRYKQIPEFDKIRPRVSGILMVENGFTLAKYRLYLDKRLDEASKLQTVSDGATRAQKMLLLYYLGVLDHLAGEISSKTKLAKVLQILINANSDNIEKDMTSIQSSKSKLRTRENFEFLANALDLAGKKDKAEEVRNTLLEIHKKEK